MSDPHSTPNGRMHTPSPPTTRTGAQTMMGPGMEEIGTAAAAAAMFLFGGPPELIIVIGAATAISALARIAQIISRVLSSTSVHTGSGAVGAEPGEIQGDKEEASAERGDIGEKHT
ncbi:unnamed protein product [Rhizoctonia solani]|uniref:Uncharacterized protein n=1 Tax=Rhizoctonia solani TaxID=456999 RepID=A0A8H3C687_9AGAM|nr:unnamed protein product [Rhizoctonia solani]